LATGIATLFGITLLELLHQAAAAWRAPKVRNNGNNDIPKTILRFGTTMFKLKTISDVRRKLELK